jgi:ABC-type amino acid transport system permease subunit
MCFRCDRTVWREMEERRGQRLYVAFAAEIAVTVGMLVMHSLAGFFLGIPLAIIGYFVTPPVQRRRLIKRLAPMLATTIGEVPPLRQPNQHVNPEYPPVSGMESYHD